MLGHGCWGERVSERRSEGGGGSGAGVMRKRGGEVWRSGGSAVWRSGMRSKQA
jgi:hypothetical protein